MARVGADLCVRPAIQRIPCGYAADRHGGLSPPDPRGAPFDCPPRVSIRGRNGYSLTYSNANSLLLMPFLGGAIQLAILPGSVTGCMIERR